MSAAGGASRGLKVVDRRWFTEDGQLREDRDISASKPEGAGKRETEPRQEPKETNEPPIPSSKAFLELIAVLAQQAEMLIVGGHGMPRQVDQGLRLIEYLAALENKTRGNLSVEESQALSNTLFQLRAICARENR